LTTGRRDRTLRLKHREEQEAAFNLRSLEATVRDFERVALNLARQIAADEARTGIAGQAHFAYSTLATAASRRRRATGSVSSRRWLPRVAGCRLTDRSESNLVVAATTLHSPIAGSRLLHDSPAVARAAAA
jgi:hypothetical protein